MRKKHLSVMVFGNRSEHIKGVDTRDRIQMEARDAVHLHALMGVAGIGGKQHRPSPIEFDEHAVMACRVARSLDQTHTLGNLHISFKQFIGRGVDIASNVEGLV